MLSNAAKVSDSSEVAEEKRGMLVIVSSPSGGGKGTLIRRALAMVPDLVYSVSWTTRQPRSGEIEGHDYYFVSVETFEQMRARNEFLEWACVHSNLYGTAHTTVKLATAEGRDVVLEIDVQGAATVAERVKNCVSIFILPPSFEILSARLTARATEASDDLAVRLRNSRREVECYRKFDYVVLNDEADRAAKQLASIVFAERTRRARQESLAQRVLETFPETSEAAQAQSE